MFSWNLLESIDILFLISLKILIHYCYKLTNKKPNDTSFAIKPLIYKIMLSKLEDIVLAIDDVITNEQAITLAKQQDYKIIC